MHQHPSNPRTSHLAPWAARRLAPSAAWLALGLLGTSCASNGRSVEITDVGDGTLVVVEHGSLIAERPTDAAGRAAGLAEYLRQQRARFGQAELDPSALEFVDAVDQEEMTDEAGDTFTLAALQQTHMGAPVIDELQMAAFARTPHGDELRRVRGRLRDPATLPTPPAASERPTAESMASSLAIELGLSADRTTLSAGPVISAAHGVAGYLVSQLAPDEDGGFHRFEAIVDPVADTYVVLVNQPSCARPALAPGVTIGAGPVFNFDPPTDPNVRPIRIHAVQLEDADGGNRASITRAQVRRWVLAANTVWYPETGIRFDFDDSASSPDFQTWKATRLNTLPANEDEEYTYRTVGNVWALLFHHEELVVFFRANGGHGFSWGPQTTFFVSMPSYGDTGIWKPGDGGGLPNDTLLSHELGHYFGLAHTFGGESCANSHTYNGDGDAGGQDPNTNADDVSDTNADMSDKCVATDSLTCVGGAVTYNDESWNPPWTNVMSYHDCLPEVFSDDQVDVINLTLQHPVRANLLH